MTSLIKISDLEKYINKEVDLFGWVHSRRDHGKLTFIDLRDYTGLAQVVFDSSKIKESKNLGIEDVVKISGTVHERPKGYLNPKIVSGRVEVECKKFEILNQSKTLPFEIDKDTSKIDEELRLEYRYLDLRSKRLQKNIRARHKLINYIRGFLDNLDFCEIETPILTRGTPEGAREFIVPSRLHPGKVYVLPQSPQQYKQLLMVAGFQKYYQIAKCLRDEDTRGDRQPEHTQLDLEMSFVEGKDVMEVIESLIIKLVKSVYPQKKIVKIPFPKISYEESMRKYKSDKPDLRGISDKKKDADQLSFAWIIDYPLFEKDKDGNLTYSHNPFTAPKKEYIGDLEKNHNIQKIVSEQYDLVLNGFEVGGGGIRIHDPKILEKIFEILGYSEDIIRDRFGHMLRAFEYGVPPHGGIALGLDRLMMILQDQPNIREVIAFPKTGDALDPMMGAPSKPDQNQIKDLKIKFIEK